MKILKALAAALILSSCSSTHQTRDISKPSGFLKDYSKLKPGKDNEAQMRYLEEGVSFNKYKKVMVDPIEAWLSNSSELKQIPKSELKDILNYLHSTFINNLKGNFQIVNKMDSQTLRIRIALTDGESSEPVTDALSNIVPITLAASYLKRAAVGTHISVGKASIEAEFIDGKTGKRIAAAMDSRAGGKTFDGDKFDEWADVKGAFDYWSEKTNKRLIELGAGSPAKSKK